MKPSRKFDLNLKNAVETAVDETGLIGKDYSNLVTKMEEIPEENLYEIEIEEDEDIEEEMEEATTASSSGSFEGPQIWAKNRKNWRAVADKNFPKSGGKGAKYVKVKEKCKTFPYCNQGDVTALDFYEDSTLRESIDNAAKKTGLPKKYVQKLVVENIEHSPLAIAMRKLSKKRSKNKKYTKEEIEEILIRKPIYKSPVTDPDAGIIGVTPINKPIGKIFTMNPKGVSNKYG